VWVEDVTELPEALASIGLSGSRPTLVLVGGADGLAPEELERLRPLFADTIVPVVAAAGGAVVDGGTDSGVMRLMGEGAAAIGLRVPLVGVAASATVTLPGDPTADDNAELEPHHSHFVFVPGDSWGDEAKWLPLVATVLAGPLPSVTLLVNGGETAWRDVEASVAAGRTVLVLDGSGRAADQMAAALELTEPDDREDRLFTSGLVEAVDLDLDGAALADALRSRLGKGQPRQSVRPAATP